MMRRQLKFNFLFIYQCLMLFVYILCEDKKNVFNKTTTENYDFLITTEIRTTTLANENNEFTTTELVINTTKNEINQSETNIPSTTVTLPMPAIICHREESYTSVERNLTMQPVKVRTDSWCIGLPPRCSNYRTELKEVLRLQNVTKTRLIEHCCPGYIENTTKTHENTTNNKLLKCKPYCHGGCGHGVCSAPHRCTCNIGFTGPHCNQSCSAGMWGLNCANACGCRNGSLCDHKTGLCKCTEGWMGDGCNVPCPIGFYGIMCVDECKCHQNKSCHPVTGKCLVDNSQILFDWSVNSQGHEIKIPNEKERIQVKHWVKIDSALSDSNQTETVQRQTPLKLFSNDTNSISNAANRTSDSIKLLLSKTELNNNNTISNISTTSPSSSELNNSLKINALSTSIVNLTENIHKLSEHIANQSSTTTETVTLLLSKLEPTPGPIIDFTTMKLIEVLKKGASANEHIVVQHPDPIAQAGAVSVIYKEIGTNPNENSNPVVHVLNDWQLRGHVDVAHGDNINTDYPIDTDSHDNLYIAIIVGIIIIVIFVLGVRFLYIREHSRQSRIYQSRNKSEQQLKINSAPTPKRDRSGSTIKIVTLPLPEVPEVDESKLTPTKFQTKESPIYAISKKVTGRPSSDYHYATDTSNDYAKKLSIEHMYDEIKYQPAGESNSQDTHKPWRGDRFVV